MSDRSPLQEPDMETTTAFWYVFIAVRAGPGYKS